MFTISRKYDHVFVRKLITHLRLSHPKDVYKHTVSYEHVLYFIYSACDDSDGDVANVYSITLSLCKELDESVRTLNKKEKHCATPPSTSDPFYFFLNHMNRGR